MTARSGSPAARGALWMLLASFSYVASATLTRQLAGEYSVFELTFLRCAVGLAVLTPLVLSGGTAQLRTAVLPLHALRTVFTYVAILLWFLAATEMPVGDFFALQFTNPLFTIACAALFLRERIDAKSWTAALVGFAGVLLILRPGAIAVTVGAVAALGSAAAYATVNTTIKVLSRSDSPAVMTFYANLLIVPLSLVPALFAWRTPPWEDVPVLAGVALFSTLAQYSVAASISLADARIVQPMNFLRLPIAAVLGYLAFAEFPDLWTWAGAAVIFGAAWYAVQHRAAGDGR